MTSLVEANIFTTAEAEETGTFLLLYLQFGVRAWMPLQYSLQESLLRRNKSILKRNFLQKMISKGLGTNKVESIAESLARDSNKIGKAKEAKKKKLPHKHHDPKGQGYRRRRERK